MHHETIKTLQLCMVVVLAVAVGALVALPHIITHYGKKNAELNDVNK